MSKRRQLIRFITVVIILTVSFIVVWRVLEIPSFKNSRNEFELTIHNDMNNGSMLCNIEYVLDFERKINFNEKISNNQSLAKESPFKVAITFFNNVSFWIWGINEEFIYVEILSDTKGVNFTRVDNHFYLSWFKSDFNLFQVHLNIYFSNAIIKLDPELFALSFDTQIVSYHTLELTNNYKAQIENFELHNIDSQNVKIEDTNVNFARIFDDNKESVEFYNQEFIDLLDRNYTKTNIDLDFTTTRSRRQQTTSDIFFDLMITFPTTSFISYLILDRIINRIHEEQIKAKQQIAGKCYIRKKYRHFK